MSERSQTVPTPEGEYFESSRFTGLSFLLGLIAVVALALSVVGAFVNPHQLSYSWLFAFAFFFTLCAGCFFWTIVHHATDAEWSVVVRRQLENIAALLVVLALLFVPILLLRHHLYAWMDIPPGHEASLDSKRAYLNWSFFLVRAVLFLGFFAFASLALRRFSVRQDKDGNPRFTIGMRKVAFISLPMFALCLTFGAFDWEHYHIMGKWMFAFCVFWAYIGFGQYMLIWYANMPEETQFFITRNTESWWALSMLLVIGRFFIPFGILLLRSIKMEPRRLCIVAGWIVCMQMLDMYIIVLPALHGTGVQVSIWDVVSLIAIGATLGFAYLRVVAMTSLFPVRDPRLIESLKLVN